MRMPSPSGMWPLMEIPPDSSPPINTSSVSDDAESALIALGYKPAQASQMVAAAQAVSPELDSEALIRLALKNAVG